MEENQREQRQPTGTDPSSTRVRFDADHYRERSGENRGNPAQQGWRVVAARDVNHAETNRSRRQSPRRNDGRSRSREQPAQPSRRGSASPPNRSVEQLLESMSADPLFQARESTGTEARRVSDTVQKVTPVVESENDMEQPKIRWVDAEDEDSDAEGKRRQRREPDRRDKRNIPDYQESRYSNRRSRTRQDYDDDDEERHGRSRRESFGSDTMDAFEKFDFDLPSRFGTTPSMTESARDTDISEPESSEPPEQEKGSNLGKVSPQISQPLKIYSSEYEGNAEMGGSHRAALTTLNDPQGRKQPLFRWLHVRQSLMNFDEFWAEISRQTQFSDVEKAALAKIRGDLKRNCVRTRNNSKGSKIGYMEPKFMQVPLRPLRKGNKPDEPVRGFVRWVCLPYFLLQQYGGLLTASGTSSFPSQTLLQTQYSRTMQQRDMEQAVRQLGNGKKNECFHVAQLWCLVIQNSFLFTCGTMSQAAIDGESVHLNIHPPKGPSLASSGKILVTCGDSITWSFSADECPSWFTFLSHFGSFWPQNFEVRYKGQVLQHQDWSRILQLTQRPKSSVTLHLLKIPRPDPPQRAHLLKQPQLSNADQNQTWRRRFAAAKKELEYLHVLTLQSKGDRRQTKSAEVSMEVLKVKLSAVDVFLKESTSYSIRNAYKTGREFSREDVIENLTKLESWIDKRQSEPIKREYEKRIDIFNAADILFGLFLPSSLDGPTVRKFWGAIKTLIYIPELGKGSSPRARHKSIIWELRESLRSLSVDIQAFQCLFACASAEDRSKIELPNTFVTAWLHTLTGIILASSFNTSWSEHMNSAKSLLNTGMKQLVQDLPAGDLVEKMAVMPMDIVALSCVEMLKDQVGKSDDILETYSQYLNFLDTDITTKPSDRSYQHRIDLVQQEMTAIKKILAKQRWVLSSIRKTLPLNDDNELVRQETEFAWARDQHASMAMPRRMATPTVYGDPERIRFAGTEAVRHGADSITFDDQFAEDLALASRLSPTDAGGLRGLFFAECSRLVEQREYEFLRHTEYAEDLERAIAYKMDWTKDRQESAIYAFTLVTIIFLPLSAISSIFGMNSSDLRDMAQGQWLYWAVALPVTFGTILVGLWWMNELGNLVDWCLGRATSRANPGYPTMMATQPPEAGYYPSAQVAAPVPDQVEVTTEFAEFAPQNRMDTYASPTPRINRYGQGGYGEVPQMRMRRRPPPQAYMYRPR